MQAGQCFDRFSQGLAHQPVFRLCAGCGLGRATADHLFGGLGVSSALPLQSHQEAGELEFCPTMQQFLRKFDPPSPKSHVHPSLRALVFLLSLRHLNRSHPIHHTLPRSKHLPWLPTYHSLAPVVWGAC